MFILFYWCMFQLLWKAIRQFKKYIRKIIYMQPIIMVLFHVAEISVLANRCCVSHSWINSQLCIKM